jgi:acetyl-CoA/propionyl-CoA carboxylase, biotin carboxylase, biotin carboxyl carrier protein
VSRARELPLMFSKVLIANRGEIAVRIARTCRERGVHSVAVYSDVDAKARHVAAADESVHLPGSAPADTYLVHERVIQAARDAGAEAIHPGYGFLSESAEFAQAVIDAGIAWVGPPPEAARAVGDKISARKIAESAGVPVVPGLTEPASVEQAREFAAEHGFPIAIKASGGGGGRGMKVVRDERDIESAYDSARREAEAYFSSSDVYVEHYLENPKHLEVQILAPNPDEALWLGVRDCSMQRRHQKLIEETPPARFSERMSEMGQAAVALAKACGYQNAGTAEFLVDDRGDFYFLEVNARLQVEHTVTEEVLGLDLVACQLQIAAGDSTGITQDQVENHMHGHAIECRINAEDPTRDFLPTPGSITAYTEPNGLGVRVDSGYQAGDAVPDAYDSLIAKLVTWGNDRGEARVRMLRALDEFVIEGIATTIPAHRALLESKEFMAGSHSTRTVEDGGLLQDLIAHDDGGAEENVLLVEGRGVKLWHPSMSSSAAAAVHGGIEGGELVAPMQGTILKLLVSPSESVEAGQGLLILEAMKMETTLSSTATGTVEFEVQVGENVAPGQILARVS